jgi:hypothetical protein
MKVCNSCNKDKSKLEFSKDKYQKDGLQVKCKLCAKEYRLKNIDKIKLNRLINLDKNKIYQKQYRINNKEYLKYSKQKNYNLNKDKILNTQKEYYQKNKENIKTRIRNYTKKNKEKINKYRLNKKNTDPLFKLICNISNLILFSIKSKGYSKKTKTYKYLGCTFEEFKVHLEKQFTEGMNWDNQGKWHLDHIKPISLAKTEKEVIELNHYTNFQPLWAEDNLRKSNKYEEFR